MATVTDNSMDIKKISTVQTPTRRPNKSILLFAIHAQKDFIIQTEL